MMLSLFFFCLLDCVFRIQTSYKDLMNFCLSLVVILFEILE